MKDNLFTLVYFKPSASGYDYTDGHISSDDELTIEVFNDIYDAALHMAHLNAEVYRDGTLNRKTYDHINEPLKCFNLLINGIDRHNLDFFQAEEFEEMDNLFDVFWEVYRSHFRERCEQFANEKKLIDEAKILADTRAADKKRREMYLKLRDEFENKGA